MDPFWLKLALSFVVGGGYIALSLWASERLGPKIGGIATGLPTTMLISLLFIAWTQDANAAVAASSVVPATIAACALFLILFAHLAPKGTGIALLGGLAGWFAVALPFAIFKSDNLPLNALIGILGLAVAVKILSRFPDRRVNTHMTPALFAFRMITAGLVVATAVLLGKTLGPLWGGIFGGFPAAFSSTMVLLTRRHSSEFAGSVAKNTPYGSFASIVFAAAFYYLVPTLGLGVGVIVAYVLCLLTAVVLYQTVLSKR